MCGTHGVMLPGGSCRGDSGWYPPIKGGICERVGRLCRPDIHCVSDRSVYDTCNKRADGCSSVGACLCSAGYGGLHCNEKLEPTGEQIPTIGQRRGNVPSRQTNVAEAGNFFDILEFTVNGEKIYRHSRPAYSLSCT